MTAADAHIKQTVADIQRDLRQVAVLTTRNVRAVRRRHARILAPEGRRPMLDIVRTLLDTRAWPERVVAYELLAGHEAAFASLNDRDIDALGHGLDDWGSIDLFGVTVAGPAWRQGVLSDRKVMAWAKSKDVWRRRLSLVATVPLNARSSKTGDSDRTLTICRVHIEDREPMVVKALSWALRALAKRDAASVRRFVEQHEPELAALVNREVRNLLETGRKTPRSR